MLHVDINCDMGESFGAYTIGRDEEILQYITSANIACGFHAGDPATMRKTVKLALHQNVAIGAHPGLQDLAGFGRRNMAISPQEAYDLIVYQIGALYGFVKAEGAMMQHVKPHGALFNMAARDASLAEAIAEAVYKVDGSLILFGLAGGELGKAARRIGLRAAEEVFADRTYQADGSLTPRTHRDAVIRDTQTAVQQVIRMIQEGKVRTLQGTDAVLRAETICIHGDGAHAVEFAAYISHALQDAGIQPAPIRTFL